MRRGMGGQIVAQQYNAMQRKSEQSNAEQNTHCPQVFRAKHLWASHRMARSATTSFRPGPTAATTSWVVSYHFTQHFLDLRTSIGQRALIPNPGSPVAARLPRVPIQDLPSPPTPQRYLFQDCPSPPNNAMQCNAKQSKANQNNYSSSTGASREAPVDKRARRPIMQCKAKQTKANKKQSVSRCHARVGRIV